MCMFFFSFVRSFWNELRHHDSLWWKWVFHGKKAIFRFLSHSRRFSRMLTRIQSEKKKILMVPENVSSHRKWMHHCFAMRLLGLSRECLSARSLYFCKFEDTWHFVKRNVEINVRSSTCKKVEDRKGNRNKWTICQKRSKSRRSLFFFAQDRDNVYAEEKGIKQRVGRENGGYGMGHENKDWVQRGWKEKRVSVWRAREADLRKSTGPQIRDKASLALPI